MCLLMALCLNGFAMAETETKLNYTVEQVDSYTAYVKTRRAGSRLNLRAHPKKDARVLKKLPTGTQLKVIGVSKNYLEVEADGLTGFVQSRYVTLAYPLATMPVHTYYPAMNDLAEPRMVTISPDRRGGFVNMRTGPSRSEPVAKYVYENDVLMLLAIDRVWVKVMDPETQQVGYIMRHFVCGI